MEAAAKHSTRYNPNLNLVKRSGGENPLYLTSDDDGAPFFEVAYGIDSHSKRNTQGTIKGRYGRLDGIIDLDFPSLDGTQKNLFGSYIDGGYFNNVEIAGTLKVLSDKDDAILVDVPNLKIDSENEIMSVGQVFEADGSNNSGKIASTNFDGRYLFAHKPSYSGDPDPTDLDNIGYLLDAEDGVFYSDSTVQVLYNRFEEADIDTNNSSASSLDEEYWQERVVRSTEGTSQSLSAKIKVKFDKRFGLNTLRLVCFGRKSNNTKIGVTHKNRIGMRVVGEPLDVAENSLGGSDSFIVLELDASTLLDGVYYEVEVYCESEVTIESGAADGGNYTSQTYLREDVLLLAKN